MNARVRADLLRSFSLVFILTVLAVGAMGASELKHLRREYLGKTVLLRGMYAGNKLQFDSSGNLIGTAEREAWTVAQIEITKIDFKHKTLEISGRRLAMVAASDGSLATVYRGFRDKDSKETKKPERVAITMDSPDPTKWESSIRNVLILDRSNWNSVIPEYWHAYLDHSPNPNSAPDSEGVVRVLSDGTKVYKAGGAVSQATATYSPDPEYTEPARQARYQGTAVYQLIVDTDGRPRDIQIKKPLGFGLDDNGAGVIRQWKFVPAMREGKPVCVAVNVEVSWALW
jgi:TonB family protein